MTNKTLCSWLAVFLLLTSNSFGQVNEGSIEIDASFGSYLELRIVDNPVINWEFKSIAQYEDAYWPVDRQIDFEVSSSTSFMIQCTATDMVSAAGDKLDRRNLGWRIGLRRGHTHKINTRYKWGSWDGDRQIGNANNEIHSGIFISSDQPKTMLLPGPDGNAGDFDDNQFVLRIGLGRSNIRNITRLPNFLQQGVKPGVYTGTITIYALASY